MTREAAERKFSEMQHGDLVDALMKRGCEFNQQASEEDLRREILDDMAWNEEFCD